MFRTTATLACLSISASSAFADDHTLTSGYALIDGGKNLVVMADIAKPAKVSSVALANKVKAIAWRPVTGELLGFAGDAIYKIDPASGDMTNLGAKFKEDTAIAKDTAVAFDFNNKIDAVRAVSSAGDNLVYFPTGFGGGDEKADSVRRFTSLAYAEGDKMEGSTPRVFANAYTNAIVGKKAQGTFQYALDAETDALVSLANNAGTLETIGKVTVGGKTVDLAAKGGFDIASPTEGTDKAYAILQMEGAETAGLYSINLETAEATELADLGIGGVSGFAVSQ